MKAKDIMHREVVTIDPQMEIEDIAKVLSENNISGVPVVEEGKLVGIVSEGDLLYKESSLKLPNIYSISAFGSFIFPNDYKKYESDLKKFMAIKAGEIMTKKLITATEDTDVSDIASTMVSEKVNRIPILKDEKLVGIITRADIIKNL